MPSVEAPEENKGKVSITLSQNVLRKLDEEAERKGLSRSTVIQIILYDHYYLNSGG